MPLEASIVIESNPQLGPALVLLHPAHKVKIVNLISICQSDIPDSDAVVACPPCPPWAPGGNHEGIDDPRAIVFEYVIDLIIHLAIERRCLKWFIIENAPGIRMSYQGREPYICHVMERFGILTDEGWTVVHRKVNTHECGALAQVRERVYVIGLSPEILPDQNFLFDVPRPFDPIHPPLSSFLDVPSKTDDEYESLPVKQKLHVAQMNFAIVAHLGHFALSGERRLVCFQVDRQPRVNGIDQESSWGATVRNDAAPTLTCKNANLWICGDGSPEKVPFKGRKMTLDERCRLCGVVPWTLNSLNKTDKVKALGNMMPVGTVGWVMKTVMHHVALSEERVAGVDSASGAGPKRRKSRRLS